MPNAILDKSGKNPVNLSGILRASTHSHIKGGTLRYCFIYTDLLSSTTNI